jgi:hypothetical protein
MYFANPAGYTPVFHSKILPHLSVLVNGMCGPPHRTATPNYR